MKVIGLTGNIGSGKSTVARMLEALGARVIDADQVAREVVEPGEPAWREILDEFGEEIIGCNARVNRKRLADIVFADASAREKLNRITHPRIIERIKEKIERYRREGAKVVIVEAALIVERGGLRDMIDKLVVVTAEEDKQIERLLKEGRFTRHEVLARIRAQMKAEEKAAHADFVIDNSGSLESTAKQVLRLWDELCRGRAGSREG
jgi:dephospho-CoA kinase